ncbi:coenzyme Q-binding protein COQ10 homolog, mitochondrial isoform 2-T2 [Clarias gariepinus]
MAKRSAQHFLRALAELPEGRSSSIWRKNSIRHVSSCGVLATSSNRLKLFPVTIHTIPARKFINLAAPVIARKVEYSENRTIEYSVEQIYSIVANVDKYQQFVPWCKRSKVIRQKNGDVQAQLEIGFPPVIERYVSEVTVIPNYQVRAVCTDGSLFRHLDTLWRFTPASGNQGGSCDLEFYTLFSQLTSELTVKIKRD